jgi:lipoyl(octanoyl) transferase
MQNCDVFRLGCVSYTDAWLLQKSLARMRGGDGCHDALLLLEHPHTYTLGSSGKLAHLLFDETELAARGITVHQVDRGGDITYHGPGQLVGYPITRLESHQNDLRADVVAYVRQLEEVLIQALALFGIEGERLPGYTGVWVQVGSRWEKIAAIGVKVTVHRVTYHGFALNVNTDLSYFQGIIPCGIPDKRVTGMKALLGHPVQMEIVTDAVIRAFGDVFQCRLQPAAMELSW